MFPGSDNTDRLLSIDYRGSVGVQLGVTQRRGRSILPQWPLFVGNCYCIALCSSPGYTDNKYNYTRRKLLRQWYKKIVGRCLIDMWRHHVIIYVVWGHLVVIVTCNMSPTVFVLSEKGKNVTTSTWTACITIEGLMHALSSTTVSAV